MPWIIHESKAIPFIYLLQCEFFTDRSAVIIEKAADMIRIGKSLPWIASIPKSSGFYSILSMAVVSTYQPSWSVGKHLVARAIPVTTCGEKLPCLIRMGMKVSFVLLVGFQSIS